MMSFDMLNAQQGLNSKSLGVQITVQGLTKRLNREPLCQDFNLEISSGKLTCIFGPNGCGKSTLLNMIAGLIPIDAGRILFSGKPLHETRIGYVFQNYRDALYPWLRAIDNIKYPLKVARYSSIQQRMRVEELMHLFNSNIDLNRYPYELSGGQQQLVSIMRALAIQPEVLFLDEPFSALDYEATLSIRDKLQAVLQSSGLTMVMISHDLEEAVYMADQILLLTRRPTQVAECVEFHAQRPRTAKTLADADFIRVRSHCLEVFQREVHR